MVVDQNLVLAMAFPTSCSDFRQRMGTRDPVSFPRGKTRSGACATVFKYTPRLGCGRIATGTNLVPA